MGRDKAGLVLGGRTLLARVVGAGVDAGLERIIVVAAHGQSLPSLPSTVVRIDDPSERAFEGPLSGLSVGLDELDRHDVAVTCIAPCDSPFVGGEHFRFLLERLRSASEHTAVVPCEAAAPDGHTLIHSLHSAVQVKSAARCARRLLEEGQRAAKALFAALDTLRLDVAALPEPRAVQGCNTPEQWAEVTRQFAAR